jgi:hypothetical protein
MTLARETLTKPAATPCHAASCLRATRHGRGGGTLRTLLRQNDVLVEAGYLIQALKLTPVLQFARRDISDRSLGDEKRTAVGADYWLAGQNANVKALYTRIAPRGLAKQNEFTVQLQIFYF